MGVSPRRAEVKVNYMTHHKNIRNVHLEIFPFYHPSAPYRQLV